ncbi:MAG: hypothetical protein O6940_14145 [Ignavibacteria bacterium]|nr:hypothetical protein [Ignavibacteria bacterium]
MKQYVIVFSIVVVILASMTLNIKSQPQSSNLQGWEPYTPTKIDWLSVVLNASNRIDWGYNFGYSLDFIVQERNTILIYVRYRPNVDRELMNNTIETSRRVIKITAKSYGWDKWIKVREDVKMTKKAKK